MTHRLLGLICSLMLLLPVQAARPLMRELFVAMPDSVLPLLTEVNRLDFIDFFDSQMTAQVTNRLDGISRMDTLTDDYIAIRYTRKHEVTMKLLPVTDSTVVVCMVTSIVGKGQDSRIAFYTDHWKPLEVKDFLCEPCMDDFIAEREEAADGKGMKKHKGQQLRKAYNEEQQHALRKMDMFLKYYELSPETPQLECRLTSMAYLNEEDAALVTAQLRPHPVHFVWSDGRFVQVEP